MTKCHSFRRSERITTNCEFKRARRKGASYRDGVFILNVYKNGLGRHRFGMAVGASKVPLSSRRNRLKRLMREAFRIQKVHLKNGPYDVVLSLMQAPAPKIGYSAVEKRFLQLLKRAKAL